MTAYLPASLLRKNKANRLPSPITLSVSQKAKNGMKVITIMSVKYQRLDDGGSVVEVGDTRLCECEPSIGSKAENIRSK